MGGDWPVKTVAECASSEPYSTQIGPFGKALMADEYTESGVPVLRGGNVNRGRFHDDDFVFSGNSIDAIKRSGNRMVQIAAPQPAVLFGHRSVSFHMIKGFGLIEIIHGRRDLAA